MISSELLMYIIVSSSANLDVSNFEMKSQVFIVVAICSKYILVSCQAGKRTSKEVVERRRTQQTGHFEPPIICYIYNFEIFYPFYDFKSIFKNARNTCRVLKIEKSRKLEITRYIFAHFLIQHDPVWEEAALLCVSRICIKCK